MAATNILGILYIMEKGDSIQSAADLKGKTIVTSGQGSTPEYALNYILEQNGIDPETDVTIEYKAEHSEVATLALAGQADVIMVPQPFVTQIASKVQLPHRTGHQRRVEEPHRSGALHGRAGGAHRLFGGKSGGL